MQFTHKMLPLLGVTWNHFATEAEAMAFARWAESETQDDGRPCDAYVTREDDRPEGEQFVVMVRNW